MKYKNSFFRLDIKEDGTYLDIYPPVNDGKKLEIKEIVTNLIYTYAQEPLSNIIIQDL